MIDRRFVSWGAARWHIAFGVLVRLLSGIFRGRFAGPDAMKFAGWQSSSAWKRQTGLLRPSNRHESRRIHDQEK